VYVETACQFQQVQQQLMPQVGLLSQTEPKLLQVTWCLADSSYLQLFGCVQIANPTWRVEDI
jgi:hypothetical protein